MAPLIASPAAAAAVAAFLWALFSLIFAKALFLVTVR